MTKDYKEKRKALIKIGDNFQQTISLLSDALYISSLLDKEINFTIPELKDLKEKLDSVEGAVDEIIKLYGNKHEEHDGD